MYQSYINIRLKGKCTVFENNIAFYLERKKIEKNTDIENELTNKNNTNNLFSFKPIIRIYATR